MKIEGVIYKLIKAHDLGKAIRGKVYRATMRPTDAQTEDIVVQFLAGNDDQLQTAVVNVNIYVPDIANKQGERSMDLKRIEELEDLAIRFVDEDTSDFWMETDGTPTLTEIDSIKQTFINVRLRISRMAD